MDSTAIARHPKGTDARILLSSVFGPFAHDDQFGSRRLNPMELYHNQVTRLQAGFSLRMFHRSFGLLMLQANVEAPCTVLDFPTLDSFTREIRQSPYDIVGIGAIGPNVEKVGTMCAIIRRERPEATIVVGGHVAAREDLHQIIDADHIVRGDGIAWLRKFLGQDETQPVRHPAVLSGFGARIMGINLPKRKGHTAAILIPSVGCPVGCNFCSTSALFGGKGNFVNFFETGDQFFSVMCQIEEKLGVNSFFVLDENFLLHRQRALRLLELMQAAEKSWALYVFSSARVIASYTIEQLLGLGIGWVWMGLEGENSRYRKLNGINTHDLVETLQSNGIRVLGSTIIGLEEHTPDNIGAAIDYAVSHDTVFHQFMLYTPNPGTPLHQQHRQAGTLLPESAMPPADSHGQYRFNYRHPHIRDGMEEQFLLEAFRRDFACNGPSLYRLIRTMLAGWRAHGRHPEGRIRKRYEWDAAPLRSAYAGAVWAMKKWYRGNERMQKKLGQLLEEIYDTFGWKTRLIAPLFGRYALACLSREEKRLKRGWTYEPVGILEKNAAAVALERAEGRMKPFRDFWAGAFGTGRQGCLRPDFLVCEDRSRPDAMRW
ncbi:B12-binding domain-containing radical SAM protein [Desulfoferrobacter suflitae]|uniref:B12-binding domain-containing radical SAM protein n=1 Tax=Desulfoferrobacter suflitae TaxID=2865782 RepID=UPI002164A830|nr:cobalamin-dependent protein [Desulfoferrobacter suflitae]MCK8601321.1 cobalamin-dependent protein [Desulfoferrobacter suflitae]